MREASRFIEGWAASTAAGNATLLGSALGCAVHTMIPAGRADTTAEVGVNLVRAIPPTLPRAPAPQARRAPRPPAASQ